MAMMTRREVLDTLKTHLGTLRRDYGVTHLALFGSAVRDEAGQDSDIDLLVDFGEPPTFKQYMGMLIYLEDTLGCKVDLVTGGTLKPRVAPYVYRERLEITDAA